MMKSLLILFSAQVASCFLGPMDEGSYAFLQKNEPKQQESRLQADVELAAGTLEVQAGDPAQTYQLDLQFDETSFEPAVNFEREGDQAHLSVALSGKAESVRGLKTRLNLRLNPSIPVQLSTRTGVGENTIDLSGIQLQTLDLESGVGETKLFMLSANPIPCDRLEVRNGVGALEVTGLGNFGFRSFHFTGGVGGSQLDFSGAWNTTGEIEIEVGIGGVELRIPRHLGAEIRASESFLSGLNLDDFDKRNGVYVSRNMDRAEKVLQLRIRTGIGAVDVRWI